MSVIASGSVISPRSVRDGHQIVVGGADFGGGGRRQPHHRLRGRCPPGSGSPSCSRPASSSIRQPASTAWPGPGLSGCDGDHRWRARPLARPTVPSWAISSPAAARVGRPRSTPISSARNCSTRRSGVALVCSAGSNGRIRPSQLTNAPRLLHDGRDREHHVGEFGDRALPQFQADHERCGLDRGQGRVGVGQVGEFDAADQQRAQLAACAPRRGCAAVSRPAVLGQLADVPCRGGLLAGRCVADRAAAGQQIRAARRPPGRRVHRRAAVSRPAGRRSRPPICLRQRALRARWPAARRPG